MIQFPNQNILKAIANYANDKTSIDQNEIALLLKQKFQIKLTPIGYRTFIRQTYSYLRETKSHKHATEFKLKIISKSLYSRNNLL
ncbi:hypothetical protein [Myroides profundi]|nr:hypothetical protein [Myroides profundi]